MQGGQRTIKFRICCKLRCTSLSSVVIFLSYAIETLNKGVHLYAVAMAIFQL